MEIKKQISNNTASSKNAIKPVIRSRVKNFLEEFKINPLV
jgi:hypothetical protein